MFRRDRRRQSGAVSVSSVITTFQSMKFDGSVVDRRAVRSTDNPMAFYVLSTSTLFSPDGIGHVAFH
ncbi:unnamed protein product [Nippostrongylus brasiliensis]|uniref:Uncharacterized protein n=1 Tax=Nippostrongylus brasiliensis TaxID=27835 RepID=A0A0N4XV71_NIPBR|nr:unnamed protein product [Nippostrongylus brasiliensis]